MKLSAPTIIAALIVLVCALLLVGCAGIGQAADSALRTYYEQPQAQPVQPAPQPTPTP